MCYNRDSGTLSYHVGLEKLAMTKSLGQFLQTLAPPRLKKLASPENWGGGFGIGTKFSCLLAPVVAMALTFLLQARSTCADTRVDGAGHSGHPATLSIEGPTANELNSNPGTHVESVSVAREEQGPRFQRIVLSRRYFCDGICDGDINRDGHSDIVAGPFWYQGPEFKHAHAFYDAVPLRPEKSPSDSMFSLTEMEPMTF